MMSDTPSYFIIGLSLFALCSAFYQTWKLRQQYKDGGDV